MRWLQDQNDRPVALMALVPAPSPERSGRPMR
jgi:hypothetical protein